MQGYVLTSAVTLLSLLTYFWMGLRVAGARAKYGVKAPATSGEETFDRIFRTQQNTLEWLPIYLASLWLFAVYWDDGVAAIIGVVWIFGRIVYALGYAKAAGSRTPGFLIQTLAAGVLLFGALGRVVGVWLQTH
ncbi:MAG TPA: MAPEG family protein [Caulobacteraceae bacterium]